MIIDDIYVSKTQETYPRSCALTATTEAISGPTTSDAKPAAAAAGSKWPTFDLRDVHWMAALPRTVGLHNARVAAPTYDDTEIIQRKTVRKHIPRWGPRAPCPCRAPPAMARVQPLLLR